MVGGYILAIRTPLNISQLPAVIPGAYERSVIAVRSKKLILANTAGSIVPLTFYQNPEGKFLFLSPLQGYLLSVATDDTVSLEAIT